MGQARFPERQQAIRVADYVGVGGVLEWHFGPDFLRHIDQATEECLTGFYLGRESSRFHVAVAVGGAAIFEHKRVHHPVAVEPVIAANRGKMRVRADPVEGAAEFLRDLAFDYQVALVTLFAPWRIVTAEERIRGVVHKPSPDKGGRAAAFQEWTISILN